MHGSSVCLVGLALCVTALSFPLLDEDFQWSQRFQSNDNNYMLSLDWKVGGDIGGGVEMTQYDGTKLGLEATTNLQDTSKTSVKVLGQLQNHAKGHIIVDTKGHFNYSVAALQEIRNTGASVIAGIHGENAHIRALEAGALNNGKVISAKVSLDDNYKPIDVSVAAGGHN